MKQIKHFFTLLCLLLAVMPALAQEIKIDSPVMFGNNEAVNMPVYFSSDKDIAGMQFDILLPDFLEFDGDVRKIRHVLYNCSASRPSIGGKTNEEEKEVQTETISIKARPLPNGYVKAKTGDETTAETYAGWYQEVYMPVNEPSGD